MKLFYSSSKYVLEKAMLQEVHAHEQGWPRQRSLLLVPDTRTLLTERQYLQQFSDSSLLLAEVLSFSRLAQRMLNEEQNLGYRYLDRSSRSLVLRSLLLRQPRLFSKIQVYARRHGYLEGIADVLGELRRFSLPAVDLLEAAERGELPLQEKEKLLQLTQLLVAYDAYLTEHRFVDTERSLDLLGEILEREETKLPFQHVFVFGFTEDRLFTPQEWKILRALEKKSESMTVSCLCPASPDGLREPEPGPWYYGEKTFRQWKLQALRRGQPLEEIACVEEEAPSYQIFRLYAPPGREEARLCVAELQRLHLEENIPYHEMAIICPDPLAQDDLDVAARSLDFPLFLDRRLDLTGSALSRYLLTLLQLMGQSDWTIRQVLDFLRSGLATCKQEEVDFLENLWLARAVRGKLFLSEERYLHWGEKPAQERDISAWKQVQRSLLPVQRLAQRSQTWERCEDYVQGLLDYFDEVGLRQQMEERLAEEGDFTTEDRLRLAKTWQEMVRLFDRLREFHAEDEMDASTLRELLRDLLEGKTAETLPSLVEQVYVGTLREALSRHYSVIYVLGASEENFPVQEQKRVWIEETAWQIFTEQLQQDSLSAPEKQQSLKEAMLAQLDRACCKRLYLSLSDKLARSEAAEEQQLLSWLPESYYDRSRRFQFREAPEGPADVRFLFPGYTEIYGQGSQWEEDPNQRKVSLSKRTMEAFFQGEGRFSISRLENYTACPYQYFVDYLLGARERKVWQPEATDKGSLYHAVLEKFLRDQEGRFREGARSWQERVREIQELPASARRSLLAPYFEEVFREQAALRVFREAGRQMAEGRRARQRLALVLPGLLQQVGEGGFWPKCFEWSFRGLRLRSAKGRAYQLRGQIDRLDWNEEKHCFRVIDYKSGRKEVNFDRLYYGLDLQLPTYLLAWQATHPDEIPANAAYVSLQGSPQRLPYPLLERGTLERRIASTGRKDLSGLGEEGMENLLHHSQRKMGESVDQLTEGKLSPSPRCSSAPGDDYPCRYCLAQGICRIDSASKAGKRYEELAVLAARKQEGEAAPSPSKPVEVFKKLLEEAQHES